MTLDQAFRIFELIDYDIAKEFRSTDPDEMLEIAEQIKTICEEE